MSTRVTAHAGSLVTAIVVLTGAAILPGAIAAADSNQDNQFLALLAQQQIPAVEGIPSLINEAHQVCRAFDAGFSADAIVRAMLDNAYNTDPKERQFDQGRLTRTEGRFMTAAVGAYCPNYQSKLASVKVNSMPVRNEPTYRGSAYTLSAPSEGAVRVSLIGTIPEQINPPDPPQIPAPPPPTAETLSPPLPIASPPPPKQAPRPPQQPQSPPQPVTPPAGGPEPAATPPAAPPPPVPPPPAAPPPPVPPPPAAPPPPPPPKAPPPPPPPPPPPKPPPKSPPGFVQLAP